MPWLNYEEFKKTRKTIATILDEFEIKCICGIRLKSINLQHTRSQAYETDDLEYWIYCHCHKCHYDYNYEKILKQLYAMIVDADTLEKFQRDMR